MASIKSIVTARKGTAGHWRVIKVDESPDQFRLYHYQTSMLEWQDRGGGFSSPDSSLVHFSTGLGSVSDQQGMNTAFKVLGLPYYFSRKGGARIIQTSWFTRETEREWPKGAFSRNV